MVGDTWSTTAYMRTLKYFLADAAKHKARVNNVNLIGVFLQAFLSSWILCIQIIFQNMHSTLEEP